MSTHARSQFLTLCLLSFLIGAHALAGPAGGICLEDPEQPPVPGCRTCGDLESLDCLDEDDGRGLPDDDDDKDEGPWVIRGQVVFRDWRLGAREFSQMPGSRWNEPPLYEPVTETDYLRPLRHAIVEIMDFDAGGTQHDDLIGRAVTSSNGTFFFRFDDWDDSDDSGPLPDVYVRVLLQGELPFNGTRDWEGLGAVYRPNVVPEVLWQVELEEELLYQVPIRDDELIDDCYPGNEDLSGVKCGVPFIRTLSTPDGFFPELKPGVTFINEGQPLLFGTEDEYNVHDLPEPPVGGEPDIIREELGNGPGIEPEVNPDPLTTAANMFAHVDVFMHHQAEPDRGGSTLTCNRLLGDLSHRCGGNADGRLHVQLWKLLDGDVAHWQDSSQTIRIRYMENATDHEDAVLAGALHHELGHWVHHVAGGSPSSNDVPVPSDPGTTEKAALREGFAEFMRVYTSWRHDAPRPLSRNVAADVDPHWEWSVPPADPADAPGAVRRTGKAFWDFFDSRFDRNDCEPTVRCFPTPDGSRDGVSQPMERIYLTWVTLNNGSIGVGNSVSLWDWWEAYSQRAPDETADDAEALIRMHGFCELTQDSTEDIFGICP
ncbi:MAG: hypothetical protein AAF533_24180 [Acidobacteriota bacterium]